MDAAGPLLILAPARRDAEAASVLLSRRGIACRILPDIAALGAAVDDHSAGAVLVADDALANSALDTLQQALAAQPPWSDLPFVVLNRGATTRGSTPRRRTNCSRRSATRWSWNARSTRPP